MSRSDKKIQESLEILKQLGLPRQQLNERTALCLLALLNLTPEKSWSDCKASLIGITPIMDWAKENYDKKYAPNTRETFRRQSMHQFVDAGIALYNPDKPDRPVNSPHAVYQIENSLLSVLRTYGTKLYQKNLDKWLVEIKTLAQRYAKVREMKRVPIKIKGGKEISISSGDHSLLIKAIIEDFASQFVPGGELIYVGDTGKKFGFFDEDLLSSLKVKIDNHGKMPDVVIFYPAKKWLILIEAVTSHGPVDGKRHEELSKLFKNSTAGLVFVSAFPNKRTMNKYLNVISWETEVWVADSPTHLIHFNGDRFLGPH